MQVRVISGEALANVPPRWDYNPSSWRRRLFLIGLTLLGLALTNYSAITTVGYLLTVLVGLAGGAQRWKTRPFVVFLFAILICSLAAAGGALSILLIGVALDEVRASQQHLAGIRRQGGSVWRALRGRQETSHLFLVRQAEAS